MKDGNNLVIMQISISSSSSSSSPFPAASPKCRKIFHSSLDRMNKIIVSIKKEEEVNIKLKDYVNFPHFWVFEKCLKNLENFQ